MSVPHLVSLVWAVLDDRPAPFSQAGPDEPYYLARLGGLTQGVVERRLKLKSDVVV